MARADIQADIDLDSSGFRKGITKAQNSLKKFTGGAIRSIGLLAGAAGLGGLATSAINLGSKISDMAVQLRISAEALQILEFAARKAGVETSIMERAIRNVQLRTQQGIEGNKRYAEAYKTLGLNIDEVNKLPAEEKLEAIAVGMSKAEDKGAAYNAVAAILGERAGPKMMEVLQDLAEKGFSEIEKAAKDAGEVMEKDTVDKMDTAADTIESFKRKMTVMAAEVLTKLIPALKILGDGFGFVGEMMAASLLSAKAFAVFLASSIGQVIEPVIMQFKALSKGVEGMFQAMDGNVKESKQAFKESLDLAKDGAKELLNIPSDIAKEFKDLSADVKFNAKSLGSDLESRAKSISKSWSDMWDEPVKKSEEAADDIASNLGTGGTTGTGTTGTGTTGGTDGGAVETPIAKAAEAVDDKIRGKIRVGKITTGKIGGFPSRFGNAPTMRQRELAEGLNDTTLGRNGRAMDGIKASEKASAAKVEDAIVQTAKSLQTIESVMTES